MLKTIPLEDIKEIKNCFLQELLKEVDDRTVTFQETIRFVLELLEEYADENEEEYSRYEYAAKVRYTASKLKSITTELA